jgi:hypothetical protein
MLAVLPGSTVDASSTARLAANTMASAKDREVEKGRHTAVRLPSTSPNPPLALARGSMHPLGPMPPQGPSPPAESWNPRRRRPPRRLLKGHPSHSRPYAGTRANRVIMAVRRDKAWEGLKPPGEAWAHMGAEEPSGHTEFVGQGAQEVAPGDDEKVP